MPPGMIDTVLPSTALALREAVPGVTAAAVTEGAHGLGVRGGTVGRARQILRGKGVEEIADGGHGSSPGMRELMRW
jgi:hypothetical protein